jgi:hypothetical protein
VNVHELNSGNMNSKNSTTIATTTASRILVSLRHFPGPLVVPLSTVSSRQNPSAMPLVVGPGALSSSRSRGCEGEIERTGGPGRFPNPRLIHPTVHKGRARYGRDPAPLLGTSPRT